MLIFGRLGALLSSVFAALALGLSLTGLYGVVSHEVARRSREMGIRLVVGAKPGELVAQQLGEGMKLVMAGGAVGVVLALLASRALAGLLVGVSSQDPWAYGGAVGLLAVVALLAACVPARAPSLPSAQPTPTVPHGSRRGPDAPVPRHRASQQVAEERRHPALGAPRSRILGGATTRSRSYSEERQRRRRGRATPTHNHVNSCRPWRWAQGGFAVDGSLLLLAVALLRLVVAPALNRESPMRAGYPHSSATC